MSCTHITVHDEGGTQTKADNTLYVEWKNCITAKLGNEIWRMEGKNFLRNLIKEILLNPPNQNGDRKSVV